MTRISRFAFEKIDAYQAAHDLDALCRRIEAAAAPAQRARAARVREHSRATCRMLALSSAARTRRRAVTATRAAHHAAEDVRRLLVGGRQAVGALPHDAEAAGLAARLLVLLEQRLRELHRFRGMPGTGRAPDRRALAARRN